MSVVKDIGDFILYGAPHSITFYIVHRQIFGMSNSVDAKQYGVSKQVIDDRGEYFRFFTANFLHNDPMHLVGNTITFIPPCHRIIGYLNRMHSAWRSAGIFWSLYMVSGVMANIGQYAISSVWKHWIRFYFRNDREMMESINKRYDGMNWMGTEAVGASGAIFGVIGFNFCVSIQLILDRLRYFSKVLRHDNGIGMNGEEETVDDDGYLEDDDGAQSIERKRSQYHAIRLCLDLLWMFVDGVHIYEGCLRRIHLDWQWRKQERAGRNYMVADGGIVADYTHFSGIISGIALFGVYRLLNWRFLQN